jgi:cell division protein FtsI/penicillin-binding protein 2
MNQAGISRWRSVPVVFFLMIATVVSSVAAGERHLADLQIANEPTIMRISPQRGTIYDRSGRVILARTEDLAGLVADRLATPEEATRISTLVSRVAERDRETLAKVLTTAGAWRVVDRAPFSGEQLSALRGLEESGALYPARLETVISRSHLASSVDGLSLGSQLLGFVSADGVGRYGIEGYYNDLLAGAPGSEQVNRDGTRVMIEPVRQGADLILSIDAGLQRSCESIAGATHEANKALGVSIVAMDLLTGELLVSASSPGYDSARPGAVDPSTWLDPVISTPFDPGSVVKPFSIITGLEAGVVREDTLIADARVFAMPDGSGMVRNWDRRSMGLLRVHEGLLFSRNVITSKISLLLGDTPQAAARVLFERYTDFGLGVLSGVDLANEVGGTVRNPSESRWRAIDVANASFGQGVSITPLGLLAGYAAIANGGVLVRPRVARSVGDEPTPLTVRGQSVHPDLAMRMRLLLEETFNDPSYRTARQSLPEGWSGGGKTGTAEIYDPAAGRWMTEVANFSMGGWIGRAEPEVAIFVTIWQADPTGSLFFLPVSSRQLWGQVAGDIAQRISDGRLRLAGAAQ